MRRLIAILLLAALISAGVAVAQQGNQSLPSGSAGGGAGVAGGNGAGSANAMTVTTTPAVNSNAAFTFVTVLPNLANTTTTPTLTVGTSASRPIKKYGSNGAAIALVAGDYTTTNNALFESDGTNWILLNPASNNFGVAMYVDSSGNMQGTSAGNGQIGGSNYLLLVQSQFFIANQTVESFNFFTPLIIKGQGSSAAGGTDSANVDVYAGDQSGTGSTIAASTSVRAGGVSSATGIPGLIWVEESYITAGTVTLWNLVCETASMTVANCGASPANVIGVAVTTANPIHVVVGGDVPINASAAVTLGHYVCSGATAGQVTDSTTATPCSTVGQSAGIVVGTSGTFQTPDLDSTVTASTTLPIIHLRFQ